MTVLDKVFGISNEIVKSYIERPQVDSAFSNAVKNSKKQIIVYGASKQGKTALVQKHLSFSDNIVVHCSPKSVPADIYRAILRQAGINIKTSESKKSGSETSTELTTKFKATIPFIGGGEFGPNFNNKESNGKDESYKEIDFNLELPQDISELLKEVNCEKFIILENFHYLPEDVQRALAFDLRAFQELGLRFVILGVWREKNRLIQFNGDLLDRMIEIPVEPWEKNDLIDIAKLGSEKLNIEFANQLLNTIVENAFDSVGVFQELLKYTCKFAGIEETQKDFKKISDQSLFEKASAKKVDDYVVRHTRTLEAIAGGRRLNKPKDGKLPLFMPYYFVMAMLKIDFNQLVNGVTKGLIEETIKKNHHRPEDVRTSDSGYLVNSLAEIQAEKQISPPLFDYDRSSDRVKIVDSTFYFFARNANRSLIAQSLSNPVDLWEDENHKI